MDSRRRANGVLPPAKVDDHEHLPGLAWLANIQHWIERQAQSPFLNSDGVQVAQQSQLKAHSVVDVSIAAGLIQSLVTVASDDFSGEGGKRVFAQVFDELLGFGDFTALGAGWGLCRSASV